MQLSQIKLFRLIHIILLFFILSVQSGSADETDVLDFLPAILAGRASCDMDPSQEILVTPYANESDMQEIREVFSTVTSGSPKNRVHDGLDIYPVGDLKPFQAACSGKVLSVMSEQAGTASNWQVEVLVGCNEYVYDPDTGGYFIPSAVSYVFETMSDVQADGQTQLANISVAEGQTVSQGNIIGYLHAVNGNSHVHFGVSPFGAILYSLGMPLFLVCPEPFFATDDKNSILNLIHVAWPSADICYQN